MRWRVGDALNAAIGQGDTAATVLQVAVAYAAVANGGTRWRPHLARALLDADGSVVRSVEPQALGTLDVPAEDLAFLRRALRGVIEDGTARGAFAGFPVDAVPIAGKTGTAEVFGKQSTSWFASFAPADDPRYAVVMMVEQGGTGAFTSGRSVRQVYEAIFGVRDGMADPARSVLVGGDVADGPPVLGPDGVPRVPGGAGSERGAGP
jgi:penicillin-binding protein 2